MVDDGMVEERCFACNKIIQSANPKTARVKGENTIVFVGNDCHRRIVLAGTAGYQPLLGGPILVEEALNDIRKTA